MKHEVTIPVVSVITPTYNRAHTLPRTWHSLRSQTLSEFEWIVVDDGSQDNTAELVQSWQQEDSRVIYVVHSHNRGVNAARATGTDHARAPYLVFLDSDDTFYEPSSLQRMYDEIVHAPENVGAVCFSTVLDDGCPMSFVQDQKVVLKYEQVICDQKARGEFIAICRRAYIDCAPWSPYRGLEVVHHWARARFYDVMFVRHVACVIYRDAGNRLTAATSVLKRADETYRGLIYLVQEHEETLRRCCVRRLYERYFAIAMYAALSGRELAAISYGLRALRSKERFVKGLAVIASCCLPVRLRHALFRLWAEGFRKT